MVSITSSPICFRRLLSLLLSIFIIFSFLASFYTKITYLDIYFLLSLAGLALISFFSWEKNGVVEILNPFELATIWGGLAIYLVSKGLIYDFRNIWLDEYTQFISLNDASLKEYSIASVAALQQQPPLDYYLSVFSREYIGLTKLTIRFFSLFLSSLTFALIPLFFKKHKVSFFASIFCMLLILSDDWLLTLGVEGRPYSLGILSSLFLFDAWMTLLDSKNVKNYIYFFTASYFGVISIGLQPPLLIFFLTLIFALLNLKKDKLNVINLFKISLFLFLFSIPYITEIYKISSSQKLFLSDFGNSFKDYINNFDLKYYGHHLTKNKGMFLILFFISCWGIFMSFFKKEKDDKIKGIILFNMFFPFFISFIWAVIINWNYMEKYFICFRFISYLGFSYLFGMILTNFNWSYFRNKSLKNIFNSEDKKIIIAFHVSILFVLTGGISSYYILNIKILTSPIGNLNWEGMYKVLNSHFRSGDRVFMLPVSKVDRWRPSILVASKIYGKEYASREHKFIDFNEYIPDLRNLGREKKQLFFVVANDFSFIIKEKSSILRRHLLFQEGELSLIKVDLNKKREGLDQLETLFEKILIDYKKSGYLGGIRETLLAISFWKKNLKKSQKILAEIKNSLKGKSNNTFDQRHQIHIKKLEYFVDRTKYE